MKKKIIRMVSMLLSVVFLVNMIPMSVFAADTAALNVTVSSETAQEGSTVNVTIDLENNPGISSLKLNVTYDDVLTLKEVAFHEVWGLYVTAPEPMTNPQTLAFLSPFADVSANGNFATLTFEINESVAEGYVASVHVTYDPDDVFDTNGDPVPVTVKNGSVTIYKGLAGDIDANGSVNARDAILLFRYTAGWENLEVDQNALDVTGDGKVNARDAIELFRYTAGWEGIVLHRGSPCTHTPVEDPMILPSCTAAGSSGGTHCSKCGKVLTEPTVIAPTGHFYQWVIDTPPTETTTGLKHEYCSLCGNIRNHGTVIPVAEHIHHLTVHEAVSASCTEDGVIAHWSCSTCGKYYKDAGCTQEITQKETIQKALGHTPFYTEAKDPTCTEDGKSAASYCSLCGIELQSSTILPATGHSYVNETCTKCGAEKDKPLEVTSVSVDKTLLKVNEPVIFKALTNKNSSDITLTAVLYLDGAYIARVSGVGELRYIPESAGYYDAEISVSDGEKNLTYSLKKCFEVKESWILEEFSINKTEANLGEVLTFAAKTTGAPADLDYTITVYKDGVSCYSVEGADTLDFYPNDAGTYYAVISVTDSYGENQTAQSGNVVVKAQTATNPIFSVNYGTTLNVDELNGKWDSEIIVPSGKDIVLNWDKLSTDSYYGLTISTPTNPSNVYDVTLKNYTSNTYTIPAGNLIPGYEYRIRVTRYGTVDSVTSSFYFTVGGTNSILMEKTLEVYSPTKHGVYAYDDITVQWTKMNYASKYVLSLEYHCGKSYHSVLSDIELSNQQNSYTISKSLLHQGCEHRLKVYAYDALGNELDKTVLFRIEGDEAVFELSTPKIENEYFYETWGVDMDSYPACEKIDVIWENIPAAAYYSITVESKFGDIDDPVLVNSTHFEDNMFTIPISNLVGGCIYSVKVAAYCVDGHKVSSKARFFRAPYANGTTLHGPIVTSHDFSQDKNDPTCMVEQPLTITWDPVSAAASYSVYWSEKGFEDWPDYEITGIKTNTVTIPSDCIYTAGEYTDFQLKIVAEASNGTVAEAEYYIRLLASDISAPVLISPVLPTDDEMDLPSFNDDFMISWTAVEGAVSYRVRIFELYDDEYDEIFNQEDITETSFEIPIDELYKGGQFKLNVRAYDQYGNGKGSNYYFIVGEEGYIGLSKDTWNPTYEADHKYITVETIGAWTAEPSVSWITLSTESGNGTTYLKVNVSENTSSYSRFGTVIFKNASGGTAVYSVTQSANGSDDTSVVQITSPSQGDVVEPGMITAKWTCKYGWHYFNLTLTDMTDNQVVYTANTITTYYQQIPAQYIKQGHTYQLTVGQYYNYIKYSEASVIFSVEGDILPPGSSDDEDDSPSTLYSLSYVSNGDGTCYVSGIGNYNGTNLIIPSISPSGEKVVAIGGKAFSDNTKIVTLSIAEGITSIGENAFSQCINLKSVDFPDSLQTIEDAAFWGCTGLTDITLSAGVKTVKYAAFSHCTNVASITFNHALQTIGEYAFYFCGSTANISAIQTQFIGKAAEWAEIDRAYTWADESKINLITFTENATETTPEDSSDFEFVSYGNGECYLSGIGNYKGTVVDIPSYAPNGDKIVKIDANAFAGTSIVCVNINGNVTSVGNYAFANCSSLKTVNITAPLVHIGTGAFKGCSSLEAIVLPSGITYVSDETFYGCTSLNSVQFSPNITKIGERSFYMCKALDTIELPNALKTVGVMAFAQCTSLKFIYFPKKVTEIGASALAGSNNLEWVVLPTTVHTIGSSALNVKYRIDIYYAGSQEDMKNIALGSDWMSSKAKIHYNSSDYRAEFPFDTVTLPQTKREIVLMPLYGYGFLKVYDLRTGKEVPGELDKNFVVWTSVNEDSIVIDQYNSISIFDPQDKNKTFGGFGVAEISCDIDGERVCIAKDVQYCIVQSMNIYQEGSDKTKLLDSEKEYAIYALDLTFMSGYIKAPDFPDWNYGDNILNNLVHWKEHMSNFFQGKFNLSVQQTKIVLAGFIQDYGNEHMGANTSGLHTQVLYKAFKEFLPVICNIFDSASSIYKFPSDVVEAIKSIKVFVAAMESGAEVNGSVIANVFKNVDILLNYKDAMNIVEKNESWLKYIKEHGFSSWASIQKTFGAFMKAAENVGKVLGVVEFTADIAIYMITDYTVHIQILENMRDQIAKQYTENDPELSAVNELIQEYSSKYMTAISKASGDILTGVVAAFAAKAPGFGVILTIAETLAGFSSSPKKADQIGFMMYVAAMGGTLEDTWNLFSEGTVTANYDKLKRTVSIYLEMVIYANELALEVDSNDDDTKQKYLDNISRIRIYLAKYLNV